MKAPFPPQANAATRIFLVLLTLGGIGACAFAVAFEHSPSWNAVGQEVQQPILFSHRHHVQGLGLDCRYCHASVEKQAYAGIPDTATCLGCHQYLWSTSPATQMIRESARTQTPIHWQKVNVLPDHVYFDHSIHLAKGIGCASCHGEVAHEDAMSVHRSFLMRDCLSCHRDPMPHLRSAEDPIFVEGVADSKEEQERREKIWQAHPLPMNDCRACHR